MFLLLIFELSLEIIITSVHGEYRLSPLDMPPPENGSQRLSGFDLCNYMEKFADKFLVDRAKFHFQTEVLNIERDEDGKWNVAVEDLPTKSLRTLTFSRIILATGVSRIYIQSSGHFLR
jgi:dimethylaniline monooxygenase (N-oxide forming)